MTNEVNMIYANANKKDLGVLQDFSFDMCFGDSDNNFECKIQKYNPALTSDEPIQDDFILYVEYTDYGGIIDKKEIDTKTGVVTLSGRSWHGFLNSFVIEPPKGQMYRVYQGEANTVLAQVITDIGMGGWFTVDNVNSGINIRNTRVRYEGAYDCIMDMLLTEDAKLVMWYQSEDLLGGFGGRVHMKAVSRVNTGAFEEFDTSQTPFKAGKTFNKVNDLICLGQGEGDKRAVIHLYADEGGHILPYCRKEAIQDSDYYTDLDALAQSTNPEDIANYAQITARRQTGDKRYSMVYSYPNAEIVTNYKKLTTKPSDWRGSYKNYFYRDTTQTGSPFKQFEPQYKDVWELTDNIYGGKPPKWDSNYKDFYVKESNFSTTLKKVEDLPATEENISYHPNLTDDGVDGLVSVDSNVWANYFGVDWDDKADRYYERIPHTYDYEFKKATKVKQTEYELVVDDSGQFVEPLDWDTNYSSYYVRKSDGAGHYTYISIPGDEVQEYVLQTARPQDWHTNYGNYYMKITSKMKKALNNPLSSWAYFVGSYHSVSDCIEQGMLDGSHKEELYPSGYIWTPGPKWKKKTYYSKVTTVRAPKFKEWWRIDEVDYVGVYRKVEKSVAPTFVPNKYFEKVVDTIPQWRPQTQSYEEDDYGVSQLVEDFGGYWEKFEHQEIVPVFEDQDVYYPVIDRYLELCKAGEKKLLELADKDSLDISLQLENEYDVGDIVGGIDEETGIDVTKPILRKIVKIKKGIVSVDYEVD